MSLTPEAFLARYLAHIPVPRLQAVRGYGLYGQRSGERLDQARAALGQPPAETPPALPVAEFLARFRQTAADSRCPRCGAHLRFVSLQSPMAPHPRRPRGIEPWSAARLPDAGRRAPGPGANAPAVAGAHAAGANGPVAALAPPSNPGFTAATAL